MMKKIRPFLWFNGNAEEAADFYRSIFKDSKLVSVMRAGDAGPGPKGGVVAVTFELAGQEFMALNGGPQYRFTPAVSFFVTCESQAEIDDYWEKLLIGGAPVQCGWLTDKFGLSWQIVPAALDDMLADPDPIKTGRVMQAVYGMVKLDLAALQRAYDGA
jgi:predicted 3-demethylubiquinone-9 3-methyltransferase (glyoxalase superfamily)